MNDLISVIVPMYNVEVYLEKTLQSIVNQTYSNIEIILINDASTDGTEEIATAFANKYSCIKLINQPFNQGVSVARNKGLKMAKGTYITFVDSDDLLTRQALEIMHKTAKENEADLVIGIYKNFSSEGTRLSGIFKWAKGLMNNGRVFTFTNPEIFSHVYVFGKLYKKELIEENFFPEGISYAEDQPFTMYCYLHAKKIHIAPSVVYYYRELERENSATKLAIKYPLKNLKSVIDSFEIGRSYFNGTLMDTDNYALLLYVSRVIQGSIRFIFEGTILLNNQIVTQTTLTMLINWVKDLDDFLVLGSESFQKVFFENGQAYMKYLDIENQKLYLKLLRLIKDKKMTGNSEYRQNVIDKNELIDLFLLTVDQILIENELVHDNNYSVCYPNVTYYNELKREAKIHFQLVQGEKTSLVKLTMTNNKGYWKLNKPEYEKVYTEKTKKFVSNRPKILLTYRDFSGCNTLALYKSIPSYINEHFDVDFVSGNNMSIEFVRKVMESDIIITTNMEYGFGKFGFDPNKIVVDLWHGFPLKNMFYKDPYYKDKNSVAPYWSQFNYLMSYSELYSEVVNKCFKVNPRNFFITGAPRNDLLYANNNREKLFSLISKEDNGQRIIVYMPTFRLSDQKKDFANLFNIFGFDEFDYNEFTTFLEENHIELIIKAHPIFARDFDNILENNSNITLIRSDDLMNNFMDFYEVLGASDLLITDYSSVYFDYLLLNKPIIFTPTDLEEYQVERGFILDSYEKWTPGPKVLNQVDLQNEILNFKKNIIEYSDIRNQIKNKVHFFQDANSTDRVWEFISTLIERGKYS